jgi:hypothetical protein
MINPKKFLHAAAVSCALSFTFLSLALGHEDGWFKGEYVIGADRKVVATPKDGSPLVKVQFQNEAKPRIYSAEGTEKETEYIESDAKGKVKTKFIFGNTAATGKFIDEQGKTEKVTRGK